VVDDSTGSDRASALREMKAALTAANMPPLRPHRGDNGRPAIRRPRHWSPCRAAGLFRRHHDQDRAADVQDARQTLCPVFWSRDPTAASTIRRQPQPATPASRADLAGATKNGDDLARIRQALADLGRGRHDRRRRQRRSRASRRSRSRASPVRRQTSYPGCSPPASCRRLCRGSRSPGARFRVFDPDSKEAQMGPGLHPRLGNGLIGRPSTVVVVGRMRFGPRLLPEERHELAAQTNRAMLAQDYISGSSSTSRSGRFAGTLPLGAINSRVRPSRRCQAIAVNFRTKPGIAAVEARPARSKSPIPVCSKAGHARQLPAAGDTMTSWPAIGPDFKAGFDDPARQQCRYRQDAGAHPRPRDQGQGQLVGRMLSEAAPGGTGAEIHRQGAASAPSAAASPPCSTSS